MDNTKSNPVVHFEIPASDLERAGSFYTRRQNPDFQAGGEGENEYTLLRDGSKVAARVNLEKTPGFQPGEVYKDVFGWNVTDAYMPGAPYFMAYSTEVDETTYMPKQPGTINGGIMEKSDSAPYPILVLNVPSIKDSLEKVKEKGGEVVHETQQVGDMGLYARVKDSEGNIIGVWEDIKR